MTNKLRTTIEAITFCAFTCIISTVTMLGALGVDPFEQTAPQVQTIAKGDK
jgi:hypothetical protein